MYFAAGKWEAAHRVARGCMSEQQMNALFNAQVRRRARWRPCSAAAAPALPLCRVPAQASSLEAAGNLRQVRPLAPPPSLPPPRSSRRATLPFLPAPAQAERLYVAVGAVDLAIAMYKRAKQHDSLLRLVTAQRPSQLRDAHLHVARAILADGGAPKTAEAHFVEGGDWEGAVSMHRDAGAWDDAIRVARTGGGTAAAGKVAFAQASAAENRHRRGWASFDPSTASVPAGLCAGRRGGHQAPRQARPRGPRRRPRRRDGRL